MGIDHPTLVAQRLIFDVIEDGIGTLGVYAKQPMPARQALADVRAIARRVLDYVGVDELGPHLPSDLLAQYAFGASRTSGRRMRSAALASPVDATATAVGATIAVGILGARDVQEAGERLRWLIMKGRISGLVVNATTTVEWGKWTSPTLAAVRLSALAPTMAASDMIRYRVSRSGIPRYPDPTRGTAIPARRVPAMLWPHWALPLTVAPCTLTQMRKSLSAVLMVVGTRRTLKHACDSIGAYSTSQGVTRCLRTLRGCEDWDDVAEALIRLSDYLTSTNVPIDYERRAGLDYGDLLPAWEWAEICDETGVPTGTEHHKLALVRSMLFERISGLPAERSPGYRDNHWFRAELSAFPKEFTPELVRRTNAAARRYLDHHGLFDEPLTWHPPLKLLDGLKLPGADPRSVDLGRLHRLIRVERLSFTATAEALASSTDVVRYLLETHPAPEQLTTSQRRARGDMLTATRAALSRSEFIDLYQHQNQTMRQIATTFATSRQTLTRLAAEYSISLRPVGARSRAIVPPEWLHYQYVILGRTIPQIARATGLSNSAISRRAKKYGIEIRPPGGSARNRVIPTELALLLRPAMETVDGLARLRRFALAANCSTLLDAATNCGIEHAKLAADVAWLEGDLDNRLLIHHIDSDTITVTNFGQEICTAISQVLEN
ncbi:hypothetical protein [Nocardia cyriacigeorgica]|uniref:hypothetical protein n=1 Tax=Nocardia cyriacigeorgica TaxID=135487 RepID=UPI001E62C375|nr:hypothetical protein [Nocardia cyriacigeorgica]